MGLVPSASFSGWTSAPRENRRYQADGYGQTLCLTFYLPFKLAIKDPRARGRLRGEPCWGSIAAGKYQERLL